MHNQKQESSFFRIPVLRLGVLIASLCMLAIFMHAKPASAACLAPSVDYGSVTSTVSVPTAGTYTVWSRIMAPDTTNNSYLLEIDGGNCIVVGDSSSIPANQWTWVNYKDATASSIITATLSAGNHSFKMTGAEPDVKLDRVILTTDTACRPTGTGDDCANPPVNQPDLVVTSISTSPTSPATGNTVTLSAVIKNQGSGASPAGIVHGVLFSIDGNPTNWSDTDTSSLAPGASVTLTANSGPSGASTWTATAGAHTILANVDDINRITESDETNNTLSKTINIGTPDTTAPVTSITAPTSNAQLAKSVVLTANATDNVNVAKVEFYAGTTLLNPGGDTVSPYGFTWNTTTVPDGSYVLTSKAYDDAGNVATSSAINVTVDNTAPTTSITTPAAGAKLAGTQTVNAAAADAGTGVAKVELYIDGALGNTDLAAPYIFSWDTSLVANGTHTLTTKAYDAVGNVTTSSAVTVIVDNTGPVTSITTPTANAALKGTFSVVANATDATTGVTSVALYIDGAAVGSPDTTPPYSFAWNTATTTNATHSVTVKATDGAGNVTTSSAVSVTVDNVAPVVSVTAPSNNAIVTGSAVTISATATDTNGSGINRVEFYRDDTILLNSALSSAYSITWDTSAIANNPYTITAVAYDNAGNATTSSVISVTVNNATPPPVDTTAPTVSISTPANNATVAGQVAVGALSSDNVGVTKVEFYIDNNTTPTNIDTTPSYGFIWDTASGTVTDGTHTIKAKAYDAAGNNKTAIVTVTVNNAPPLKPGDVNGDGHVDVFDMSILLGHFNTNGGRTLGDLNGDAVINIFDLSILLTNYGT
jgi:major membrane immunogen (membrane-anchored lipoprotein)